MNLLSENSNKTVLLNQNNTSQYNFYFWSNKYCFGEHKRLLSKNILKILLTPSFSVRWRLVY